LRKATFTFTASDPIAAFKCSLDGIQSRACASPKTYWNLDGGSHVFSVWATDANGVTGPAATRHWTITDQAGAG